MPFMEPAAAFFFAADFAGAFFSAAAFLACDFGAAFFVAGFFFTACLAGADMVIPGMFICALAGAEAAISVSMLAAAISLLFTITNSDREGRRNSVAPPRDSSVQTVDLRPIEAAALQARQGMVDAVLRAKSRPA